MGILSNRGRGGGGEERVIYHANRYKQLCKLWMNYQLIKTGLAIGLILEPLYTLLRPGYEEFKPCFRLKIYLAKSLTLLASEFAYVR